ncbi:MAG: hypothetical protein ACTHLW_20315, partial [Verrucomicrobiota bacterium]
LQIQPKDDGKTGANCLPMCGVAFQQWTLLFSAVVWYFPLLDDVPCVGVQISANLNLISG